MEDGEERGPELRADDGEEGEVGGAVGHGHQVVERRQELHPEGQSAEGRNSLKVSVNIQRKLLSS